MPELPVIELTRAEQDALLDTWDEETTVSGTAFFPVVARIIISRLFTAGQTVVNEQLAILREQARAEKAEAAIARLLKACSVLDEDAEESGSAEGRLGTSVIRHLLEGGTLDTYTTGVDS